MQHPEGRVSAVVRSLVAVPAYSLLLPFLSIVGHHYLMRYLVKWCDHVGRLFGLFGVKLVKSREM
jgi:hypothetical protein